MSLSSRLPEDQRANWFQQSFCNVASGPYITPSVTKALAETVAEWKSCYDAEKIRLDMNTFANKYKDAPLPELKIREKEVEQFVLQAHDILKQNQDFDALTRVAFRMTRRFMHSEPKAQGWMHGIVHKLNMAVYSSIEEGLGHKTAESFRISINKIIDEANYIPATKEFKLG